MGAKRHGKEFVGAYLDPTLVRALESEARAHHRTVTQQLGVVLADRYGFRYEATETTDASARRGRYAPRLVVDEEARAGARE